MVSQYKQVANIKREVNVRRYNKLVFKRKLRLASYIPFVRLVKKG